MREYVDGAWQGLSEGFAAAASSLPEGNNYEQALGSLAAKAGDVMNGLYDWASQGWESEAAVALQEKGYVASCFL